MKTITMHVATLFNKYCNGLIQFWYQCCSEIWFNDIHVLCNIYKKYEWKYIYETLLIDGALSYMFIYQNSIPFSRENLCDISLLNKCSHLLPSSSLSLFILLSLLSLDAPFSSLPSLSRSLPDSEFPFSAFVSSLSEQEPVSESLSLSESELLSEELLWDASFAAIISLKCLTVIFLGMISRRNSSVSLVCTTSAKCL